MVVIVIVFSVFLFFLYCEKMIFNISLNEDDIFGVLFKGWNVIELKNDELKFWLKCWGDFGKGFKIKVEFVKR